MEFLPQSSAPPGTPKNLYPCLAHISISSAPSEPRATRRLSTGSFGSADGEGNALTRVISGNRRKSSFGPIAVTGSNANTSPSATTGADERPSAAGGGRRLSFGGSRDKDDEKNLEGKWYWRVQAGVTDSHLVLLPLTQPPNPVLTTPPAPLSHAMPNHSAHPSAGTRTESGGAGGASGEPEDQGLVAKMKNLFRRSSTTTRDTSETVNTDGTGDISTTGGRAGGAEAQGVQERVIDQMPKGEMLPSAKGNELGATNVNANAELGWPGVVHGEKLGAIVISLQGVDKNRVHLGGGKKGEGSYVTVPITSHFAQFAHPMIEPVGTNKADNFPKSGTIKFEFDKDWIGAKGEAEILHHNITKALSSLPDVSAVSSSPKQRGMPQLQEFQIGGGHGHSHGLGHRHGQGIPEEEGAGSGGTGTGTGTASGAPVLAPIAGTGTSGLTGSALDTSDIAPDESLGSSSVSGKVGGE
ncbi:hypothetical protein I316_00097 [Kwoniella heveanensis BCC8398]|uniref:Uncharacterized protein n=1 Tax=Kwoniella heveanensis BCC8398 TaxID=1296120 RepID=A0A1B9H3L5_9TREE|nr:hypothetical protein I316_00097 [Kwoniella heveanensis BCC8398]